MSETLQTKPSGRARDYTVDEVEAGLMAMVELNGNSSAASRRTGIPDATLRCWRNKTEKERYLKIRAERMPELRDKAAERNERAAEEEIEVAGKLVERMKQKLEADELDLPDRDLAGAIRNLDVGAKLHTDSARDLRGETSVTVVQHRSFKDVQRALQAKGVDFELPSEEVPEAKEIEG